MISIRKSLAISFAEKYSVLVIDFVTSVILARVLTPHEIGIFSVSLAFIGLAHTLRDFGVSNYIIQELELTPRRIRTAFGVALIIAWFIAAMLYFASTPIAIFYNEPGIRQVILVLAVNFLLIPFSSVSFALLRRNMQFGAIYRISIISSVIYAVVAISLGFLGYSFMSLAWANLARIVATPLIIFVFNKDTLIWAPSFKESYYILSLSSRFSIASLLAEFGSNAPDLIIGRFFGMTAVGYFSRAQGVVSVFQRLISQAIYPVMLPYFSASSRSNDVSIKQVYIQAINYMLAIAWPFLAFLGLMAYPIVRILYGPQWDAAVPIAQILCLAAALASLNQIASLTIIAIGGAHQTMIGQVIYQTCKITLILISLLFGFQALVFSLVISELMGFFIYNYLLIPIIRVHLQDYIVPIINNLLLTSFTLIMPSIIIHIFNNEIDKLWLYLIISAITAFSSWLVGLLLFNHPMWRELKSLSTSYLKWKSHG